MSPRRPRTRARHIVLSALALVLVAGACTTTADDPDPASSSPPTPASSSPAPVTLRFAVYGAPEVLAAYRQLASSYTAEHPNVTVEVEAAEDLVTSRDQVDRAFDAGTPPDLFLTP